MAVVIFDFLAILIVALAIAALAIFGPAFFRWALAALRAAFRS
jgi:hypothetical protein